MNVLGEIPSGGCVVCSFSALCFLYSSKAVKSSSSSDSLSLRNSGPLLVKLPAKKFLTAVMGLKDCQKLHVLFYNMSFVYPIQHGRE